MFPNFYGRVGRKVVLEGVVNMTICFAGRRATQIKGFIIRGILKHVRTKSGIIVYDVPPELDQKAPERSSTMVPTTPSTAPSAPATKSALNPAAAEFKPGASFPIVRPPPPADSNGQDPSTLSRGDSAKEGQGLAARRQAQVRFLLKELDAAAPHIRVGDNVSFVLSTSLNKNGGVDRLAKRVTPEGWTTAEAKLVPADLVPPGVGQTMWMHENAKGTGGYAGQQEVPSTISSFYLQPTAASWGYGQTILNDFMTAPSPVILPSPKSRKDKKGRTSIPISTDGGVLTAEVCTFFCCLSPRHVTPDCVS